MWAENDNADEVHSHAASWRNSWRKSETNGSDNKKRKACSTLWTVDSCCILRLYLDSIGTGEWIRLVGGAIGVEGFRARCGWLDRLDGWESYYEARLMPRGLLLEHFQLIVPEYFGSDRWPLLVPGSHPLRPHPRHLENKGKPACRLGEKVAWAVYRLTNISRSLASLIRGRRNRWDADIWLVAFFSK